MYRGKKMFPDTVGFVTRLVVAFAISIFTIVVIVSAMTEAWGMTNIWLIGAGALVYMLIVAAPFVLAMERKEHRRILEEEVAELQKKLGMSPCTTDEPAAPSAAETDAGSSD